MANAPSPSPSPPSSPSPRRWCSTKPCILAAFALIAILAAIITIVSFVLRSDTINFSITHASKERLETKSGTPLVMQLNITLVANNTSQRAGVKYVDSIVLLQLTTLAPGLTNYSIPTVPVKPWSWQAPRSTSCMKVSALMSVDNYNSYFPEPATSGSRRNMDGKAGAHSQIRVVVVTVVQFKIGRASMWSYLIRVQCGPVNHFNSNGSLGVTKISCSEL